MSAADNGEFAIVEPIEFDGFTQRRRGVQSSLEPVACPRPRHPELVEGSLRCCHQPVFQGSALRAIKGPSASAGTTAVAVGTTERYGVGVQTRQVLNVVAVDKDFFE